MCEGGRRLVKSMRLRALNEPRWVDIDIKSAVEQWIRKPRRNFGLQVVVRDARSRGRRRKHDALGVLDGYNCCDNVEENSREWDDVVELPVPHTERYGLPEYRRLLPKTPQMRV